MTARFPNNQLDVLGWALSRKREGASRLPLIRLTYLPAQRQLLEATQLELLGG